MNKKFVKENKTLVREFISGLIAGIISNKISKKLEKTLMSNPGTKKDILQLRKMTKSIHQRLEKIKHSDPETYNRIKARYDY